MNYKALHIETRDLINKTTVAMKVRYIVVVDKSFNSSKCHIADREVMHAHRALFELRADATRNNLTALSPYNTEYSRCKSLRLFYKFTTSLIHSSSLLNNYIDASNPSTTNHNNNKKAASSVHSSRVYQFPFISQILAKYTAKHVDVGLCKFLYSGTAK